jgi:hypothetical protein
MGFITCIGSIPMEWDCNGSRKFHCMFSGAGINFFDLAGTVEKNRDIDNNHNDCHLNGWDLDNIFGYR